MYPRILALGLAALCISARAADLIPIEDFARLPAFTDMRLSPDGEYLGYIRDYRGARRMCVTELATMKKSAFNLGEDGPYAFNQKDVTGFQWISNERLIVQTYGSWIAVDRNLKNVIFLSGPLYHKTTKVIGLPGFIPTKFVYCTGDDREVLFTNIAKQLGLDYSFYPDLALLDSRNGNVRRLEKNPGMITTWIPDSKGKVRVAVGLSGDRLSVYHREHENDEWKKTVELPKARASRLFGCSPADDMLYAVAAQDEQQVLYLMDSKNGEKGAVLWCGKKCDILDVIKDPVSGELVGIYLKSDGKNRIDWLSPKYQSWQAALDAALPGTANIVKDISRDGKKALVVSFSDRSPETAHLVGLDDLELRKLGSSMGWIKPEYMAGMRPIKFRARDGLEIEGYLTLPLGCAPVGLPLVVVPHGLALGGRDDWKFDPFVQMLASRGYAVLQVNYRGSSGYGEDFQSAGLYQAAGKVQEDIEDGTRWALSENIAASGRIAIVGRGFGGYSAMYALGKNPGLYKCGISIGGFFDFVGILRDSTGGSKQLRQQWIDKVGDLDERGFKAVSPLYFADDIKVPALLIYYEGPKSSSKNEAEKLAKALRKAGKHPELQSLAYDKMVTLTEDTQIVTFKAVEAFLAKHLGAAK